MKLPLFAPDTRNDHPFFKSVPVMTDLEEQVARKGICTKCHTKTLRLTTVQARSEFHTCRTCETTFVLSKGI